MDSQQAKALLQKYQSGNCTPEESEWVETWYKVLVDTGDLQWEEGEKDWVQQSIEARIMKQVNASTEKEKTRFFISPRYIWWAAASLIFLLGAFSYVMLFNTAGDSVEMVKVIPAEVKAPASNKAVITLSNGQKVYLDSTVNGALAIQGNVELVKLPGGKITYTEAAGKQNGELAYNTLFNPKGSKVINIILADGSKVWLNAGSGLTYPVLFVGNQRRVSINGEAYFEVAPDLSKPFFVHNGKMDVQVLGTHFNVNSFEDDDDKTKVTLLEGSVKILNGNITGFLKPGQQALVNHEIKVINEVDLHKVMAWKNGYFQFDKASLQSVLKQISRWYDVDVVYEGENQKREFVGEMERDLSLTEVLKILEINKVHFEVVGKKLIIKSD